jgi:hypothetical protein
LTFIWHVARGDTCRSHDSDHVTTATAAMKGRYGDPRDRARTSGRHGVTHDQVEAMTLADRIVVLDAGRARQIGTPIELYHAPADLFVAGFIGSPKMNFINVEAQDADRGSITVAGAGLAPFRVPAVLPSSMQPELMRWMPPPAGSVYHDGSIFA